MRQCKAAQSAVVACTVSVLLVGSVSVYSSLVLALVNGKEYLQTMLAREGGGSLGSFVRNSWLRHTWRTTGRASNRALDLVLSPLPTLGARGHVLSRKIYDGELAPIRTR